MSPWIVTAAKITGSGLWDSISHFFEVARTILLDNSLVFLNVILPRKTVKPTEWPPFVSSTKTDSRGPCPGLNALASHGIFPHDGRGIKFTELANKVQEHYNIAPSFCFYTTNFMARILHRNYRTDTLDLGDLNVHNGIEHDASMTRLDSFHQPNQGVPDEKLVLDILAASKDGKRLTAADFSRIIFARRVHSKETNPQFSLDTFHSLFAAGNAATLLLIFGGDVAAIKPFLLEERIPDGWTPSVRSRMGLTMAAFNATSLRVSLGIDPAWKNVKYRRQREAQQERA